MCYHDGVASFNREDLTSFRMHEPLSMPARPLFPLDPFPYDQDPQACRIHRALPDGLYVYVQNLQGEIWVTSDGPHQHPRVLGKARAALYAGDLSIEDGKITELTNLSGTFLPDHENGLRAVHENLLQQGWIVESGGVRFFPADGTRPRILA